MKKTKIMIVDDALFLRNQLRDCLALDDYEIVAEAANGREAVETYKFAHPDLTIMDLVMPFVGGVQAVKEILSLDNRARIIVSGALGQETEIMSAINAGALDFLMKPFKCEDVRAVVKKVMKGSSAGQPL